MTEGTASNDAAEQPAAESLVGSDRVLAVLSELARHPGGVGLDELARTLRSPKPTVHRALASLRRANFAVRNGRGHYQLGDEFIRLAFANYEARPDHLRVQPILQELAERYGETAHYAVLDGRSVVYRAKVDPAAGAVKLTSTIGGRNQAHCTAVGKLLLAFELPDEAAVQAWVGDSELAPMTKNSLTTVAQLHAELTLIRQRGYSVDDQENEPGVNCLAVPVFLTSPSVPTGAVSVSALTYRTPLAALENAVGELRTIVERKVQARAS